MQVLSISEVIALLSVSRSTLWRMIRVGGFPRPIILSPGRRGWLASDVEAWIEARRQEARGTGSSASSEAVAAEAGPR